MWAAHWDSLINSRILTIVEVDIQTRKNVYCKRFYEYNCTEQFKCTQSKNSYVFLLWFWKKNMCIFMFYVYENYNIYFYSSYFMKKYITQLGNIYGEYSRVYCFLLGVNDTHYTYLDWVFFLSNTHFLIKWSVYEQNIVNTWDHGTNIFQNIFSVMPM